MANKYLDIRRSGPYIIKTYQSTQPLFDYRETCQYYQILKRSQLVIPKTEIKQIKNYLLIKQAFIEGRLLNEALKSSSLGLSYYIKDALVKVLNSLGRIRKTGDNWVSERLFAIDASFSNFICEDKTSTLCYVDLFPPRNLSRFFSGIEKWNKLLVDFYPQAKESILRFKFYDVRGMVFDILTHFLFYTKSDDSEEMLGTLFKISENHPFFIELIKEYKNHTSFYENLLFDYFDYKKLTDFQKNQLKKRYDDLLKKF